MGKFNPFIMRLWNMIIIERFRVHHAPSATTIAAATSKSTCNCECRRFFRYSRRRHRRCGTCYVLSNGFGFESCGLKCRNDPIYTDSTFESVDRLNAREMCDFISSVHSYPNLKQWGILFIPDMRKMKMLQKWKFKTIPDGGFVGSLKLLFDLCDQVVSVRCDL